jgi:hypothetical protein
MKQNSERLKKIKEEVDRANELNDQLKDDIQLMKEIRAANDGSAVKSQGPLN